VKGLESMRFRELIRVRKVLEGFWVGLGLGPAVLVLIIRPVSDDLEENAFSRDPDLGPTLDIIEDDVPRNSDYLDESFGAAAGLMELSDDELGSESADEGEMSESVLDARSAMASTIHHSTRLNESSSHVAPSEADLRGHHGETIKMLVDEDIQIIEDYFETLEPEPLLTTNIE
jgi:autophagy-related protein 2